MSIEIVIVICIPVILAGIIVGVCLSYKAEAARFVERGLKYYKCDPKTGERKLVFTEEFSALIERNKTK